MTKFSPALNSKILVTGLSFSTMFTLVTGFGYNQQVANKLAYEKKIQETAALLEKNLVDSEANTSSSQVTLNQTNTVKKTKTKKSGTKSKIEKANQNTTSITQQVTTPSSNPAPIQDTTTTSNQTVIDVAPVVPAPAPAQPAQATTGGS